MFPSGLTFLNRLWVLGGWSPGTGNRSDVWWSGGVTPEVRTPPQIVLDPQSLTRIVGSNVIFTVSATGAQPLSYRWRFNGAALSDGGRVSGAASTSLAISNLLTSDAGNYTVVVTNTYGSVTSAVATLAVLAPPVITAQPANRSVMVGETLAFGVSATGTAPLNYRWSKNGTLIPNSNTHTWLFAPARVTNSGDYQVVITNLAGSVTSAVANIVVSPIIVSNALASQRSGTDFVDITYDLAAPKPCNITLQASRDGGLTWIVPISTVTGDVGSGVRAGTARRIQWAAGVDWPGQSTASMIVRIGAFETNTVTSAFAVNTVSSGNWTLLAWADRNANNLADAGESLPGAEVFFKGRTSAQYLGVTGADGKLQITQKLQAGDQLFVRKAITNAPAAKPGRDAVGNAMFTLWLDSDLGDADATAGSGAWSSYTVSAAEVDAAKSGTPLAVRLRHTVIEWHLIVAAEMSDAGFINKLKKGFESASTYLFDVTDGQMKFGNIAIYPGTSQNSERWKYADMTILNGEQWPQANPDGIYHSNNWYQTHMYFGNSWGGPPDKSTYYTTIVHEFGHYAFGLGDEYRDGNYADAPWADYRASHPLETPANYGLMDNQYVSSEMSSLNDYLPAYPYPSWVTNVTSHLQWRELFTSPTWYPSWQWLEGRFQQTYAGVPVEIVVPPPGQYLGNDQRSSEDRSGPTAIPAPYSLCHFPATAANAVQNNLANESPTQITVLLHGKPVAGALVARAPASGNGRSVLGVTDLAGTLTTYDLAPGDQLLATYRRLSSAVLVTSQQLISGRGQIELASDLQRGGATTDDAGVLNDGDDGNLGVVVWATVQTGTNLLFELGLQSSVPLVAGPTAMIHPNDGVGISLPLSPTAPLKFAGANWIGEPAGGASDLSCASTNQSILSVDQFQFWPVDPMDGVSAYARDGWAEVYLPPNCVTQQTLAVVYSTRAPTIRQTGFTATQVGPALSLALGTTIQLNGQSATLNLSYREADLAGVDETSLKLYQWNSQLASWQLVPCTLSVSLNVVTAQITNLGVFTLFANASPDVTPPAPINDLQAFTGTNGWTVLFQWTAVGDDGTHGRAADYVLKFSDAPINVTNWPSASTLDVGFAPHPNSTPESCVRSLPDPGVQYYFAIRARDEAGNLGPLGNVTQARSGWLDTDGDDLPDQWETSFNLNSTNHTDGTSDNDGDGLTNLDEFQRGTNPSLWDTDGDSLGDGWEANHGLNPLDPADADQDSDGDGLNNRDEYLHLTAPDNSDTDGDGLPDKWEWDYDLCPFSAAVNHDGLSDPDHDGLTNLQEFQLGRNPHLFDNLHLKLASAPTNGSVRLSIFGEVGKNYSLSASTNLVEWVQLRYAFCTNTWTEVMVESANLPQQFFRLGPVGDKPQVRLESFRSLTETNQIQLRLLGDSYLGWVVQTSTNFLQWTDVNTVIVVEPWTTVDGPAFNPQEERRFYRLRLP
jgi:hypothetical protein